MVRKNPEPDKGAAYIVDGDIVKDLYYILSQPMDNKNPNIDSETSNTDALGLRSNIIIFLYKISCESNPLDDKDIENLRKGIRENYEHPLVQKLQTFIIDYYPKAYVGRTDYKTVFLAVLQNKMGKDKEERYDFLRVIKEIFLFKHDTLKAIRKSSIIDNISPLLFCDDIEITNEQENSILEAYSFIKWVLKENELGVENAKKFCTEVKLYFTEIDLLASRYKNIRNAVREAEELRKEIETLLKKIENGAEAVGENPHQRRSRSSNKIGVIWNMGPVAILVIVAISIPWIAKDFWTRGGQPGVTQDTTQVQTTGEIKTPPPPNSSNEDVLPDDILLYDRGQGLVINAGGQERKVSENFNFKKLSPYNMFLSSDAKKIYYLREPATEGKSGLLVYNIESNESRDLFKIVKEKNTKDEIPDFAQKYVAKFAYDSTKNSILAIIDEITFNTDGSKTQKLSFNQMLGIDFNDIKVTSTELPDCTLVEPSKFNGLAFGEREVSALLLQ